MGAGAAPAAVADRRDGRVMLEDGTELKMVTGIDDHSRLSVAAGLIHHLQGGVRGPDQLQYQRSSPSGGVLILKGFALVPAPSTMLVSPPGAVFLSLDLPSW
jgi:hypothetical protein